jgi:cobaltochelatase CobS
MSGFYVTSANRNAVRKMLVSTGLTASEVRNWPTSRLGAELRNAVSAGKVTQDQAVQACKIEDAEYEFVPQGQQTPPAPIPAPVPLPPIGDVPNKAFDLATAITMAVRAAVEAVPQGTDAASVAKIAASTAAPMLKAVKDELCERIDKHLRPHVIEITVDGKHHKFEGRTHVKFDDIVRIITSRVQGRRLHAWLVGPSGSGKSYLAMQCATALKLPFYSTGAIQSKYDLIGFVSPTGNEQTLRTPFREAFENGGVFSWDDCDASDPRAFVSFNEALSNGRFAFPDKCIEQHSDFVAVASANTWGNGATADYVGRNKIDAATLSRFVRIEVDYDEGMELALVGPDHAEWAKFVQRMRKAVSVAGVKVLVTPRATLQGAALLTAGMDRKKVEAATVFAGVDKATEEKIRKAA